MFLVLGAWVLTRPDAAPEGNVGAHEQATPATSAALAVPAAATPGAPVANAVVPFGAAVAAESGHGHHEDSARIAHEITRKHEARWAIDAAAPAHASQLEQQVLSVTSTEGVASAHYQPTRLNVQCKASMCRIESDYASGANGSEWASRLMIGMAGTIGHSKYVNELLPGGGQRMVLYAYRAGHGPPQ